MLGKINNILEPDVSEDIWNVNSGPFCYTRKSFSMSILYRVALYIKFYLRNLGTYLTFFYCRHEVAYVI